MLHDDDSRYHALSARDPRFDGLFFVGVTSTGIYCRPICPARTPARTRCRFYGLPAEAEHAGFRPCLRCRPELAPGAAPVDARSRLTTAAVTRIQAGELDEGSVDELGAALGVTGRHLRRTLTAELGLTPVALAQTRRLLLAKQLLCETQLSAVDIAFASGFGSVRRFNALFRERYGLEPTALRRGPASGAPGHITLHLGYRPPLPWPELLEFLHARATPGVEHVDSAARTYARTVALGDARGVVVVGPPSKAHLLRIEVPLSLLPVLQSLLARLRALFDLDADPMRITERLGGARLTGTGVPLLPGLRVPGAFDGFELAVRAVLGQGISVRGATTLAGRLAARYGTASSTQHATLTHLFPSAAQLERAEPAALQRLGILPARARAIVALAKAAGGGSLALRPGDDVDSLTAQLCAIDGLGPWTASYVAMRALHDSDAFPFGDLVLQRMLGTRRPSQLEHLSRPWSPWRAYAAMQLWRAASLIVTRPPKRSADAPRSR